jgi:O-antigen biosynthesis protein
VNSSTASLQPISIQGKSFFIAGSKFRVKAMRLPEVAGHLGLSEMFTLRKRLEELAAANVNTLILNEAQADTILGIAGQVGLFAMVEVAIDSTDLDTPARARSTIERVANAAKLLRGHSALIALLIDYRAGHSGISKPGRGAAQRSLDAIVRGVRETNRGLMVGLRREAETTYVAVGDEDFTYLRITNMDAAGIGAAVCSLHDRAGANPLVIEFGEEFPGQKEAVAGAYRFGATGVVATATRPATASGRQKIKLLSAGELLPFADPDGADATIASATPMVSIVVAARDDERTIGACLESIRSIQYPNYEVIVADEGSRDRSIEIATAMAGVRVVSEVRGKFGAIGNEIARSARGDLIAFTRADCIVDPEWLAVATAALIEGGFDVCSGPADYPHEGRGLALRVLSSLERRAGLEEAPRGGAAQIDARNLIIRKSSLSAIGGGASRVADVGDPCTQMLAEGTSAGRCPAGFVWRQRDRSIGEFLRNRIRHGRDEAIGRATRQIAIGNNHAHAAHPAGR